MNHQRDRVSHIRLVHVPLEILSWDLRFQKNLNSQQLREGFYSEPTL